LGAQFGGGWADQQFNGGPFADTVVPSSGGGLPLAMALTPSSFSAGSGGVLAGGQARAAMLNLVAGGWPVFAVDGAWANISGNSSFDQTLTSSVIFPAAATQVASTGQVQEKTNALATGTVRFGYSFGQGLIYGKGGVAWDRTDYRFFGQVCGSSSNSCVFTTPFDFTAPTDSRWGWTAGIGTEWILVGNWSIFGEYDYLDFGSKNLTFTDPIMGQAVFSVRQHINEGKLGVNFRFY
jgi:outer membrane immunogenic protein